MKKIVSVIAIFLLMAITTTPAFANSPMADLFDDLILSDGAETDAILCELEKIFLENPDEFLIELNNQEDDVRKVVVENFAIWANGTEESAQKLAKTIESVAENSNAREMIAAYSSQEQVIGDEEIPIVDAFNVEGLKELLFSYKASKFTETDEEFYCSLIKYYLLDDKLFAKTLVGLENEEIENLAAKMKMVSEKFDYDVANTQGNSSTVLTDTETELYRNLISSLKINANDLVGKELERITSARALPPTPTIDPFYYSGTMEVGKTVTLTLPLSETTSTSTTRNYRVKVYCIRNGVSYQKIDTTYSIPAGQTKQIKTFNMMFTNPGQFTTRVEVLSTDGTSLTSRTGKNPDTTYGYWSIAVKLKKDRTIVGTYALYDGANVLQCSGSALGRSASGAAMNITNGNTPVGTYTGVLGNVQADTDAYGPYKVVKLTGKNNAYVPPRSGIWIQGGRIQIPLRGGTSTY